MASKLPKLSTNNTIALATLVTFLMVALVVIVGRNLLKQITHNGRVISKKQAAESQLKTNLANLPGLSQAYDGLGATRDLIAQALPTTPDFPAFVATTEAMAASSGVTLNSVGQQSASTPASTGPLATPTISSAGPQPYGVTIAIKGSYASTMNFIKNLQVSARPIKITDLNLNGNNDSLSGTITGLTYYYNPQVLQDKTEEVK